MISKKLKLGGAALALSVALLAGSSMSAYANVPDDVNTAGTNETAQSVSSESADKNTTESTTESAAKSDAESTAASVESDQNKAEGRVTGTASQTSDSESDDGVLTPSGNMSLVDNVKEEDKENLDFMTVTSKDGHVFYIVIDHSSNAENVYFLNQVDESDLMALMTDDEKKAIEETADTEKETGEAVTPSVKTDSAETDTDQAETENKKNEVRSAMDNNLIMGAVFGVIGLVLIGAYYFLKIRPKKKGASIEDDLEFYDDEEYENEDEADAEPAFEEEEEETRQKPDQEDVSSEEDPEKGARE
ncbi:DUF4366 domain-containing protein [Clostridium vitabionis]|uniref:DUF4366 domain-containing protein n=1 Tax=Clostridium vitabionis TaxID=2784388 RepID=UPI00188B5503|nr:DUF4366 domain-containing protein [Clostridium vitabionis]